MRLRASGGRVVLDPAIRAFYTPVGSVVEHFRKYYRYGMYKVPVIIRFRRIASVRSLAPMGFVLGIGALGAGGLKSHTAPVVRGLPWQLHHRSAVLRRGVHSPAS